MPSPSDDDDDDDDRNVIRQFNVLAIELHSLLHGKKKVLILCTNQNQFKFNFRELRVKASWFFFYVY